VTANAVIKRVKRYLDPANNTAKLTRSTALLLMKIVEAEKEGKISLFVIIKRG